MTGKFIGYCRVSTRQQGESGLGLAAQETTIREFIASKQGELVLPLFVEVESGRKADRPELHRAIAAAKRQKATLLVAKLDRLARNVAFVSALMEAKVRFVACDLPEANELTIHIFAAFAEFESKRIGQRTREGLAETKARGTILGQRDWEAPLAKGHVTIREQRANRLALYGPLIQELRSNGLSLRAIAAELDRRGIKTPRGNQGWTASSVRLFLSEN
jgi:DNA invertase Pin-like site-specific DNA recombinase